MLRINGLTAGLIGLNFLVGNRFKKKFHGQRQALQLEITISNNNFKENQK